VPRRLIVEADGGSRGNPGPAAYGALVRDAETGEVLVEIAEHIGIASNNVAEYRGAIAGLTAARDLDPEAQVEVRMDSKLVVEQLSGRWQVKHPDMKVLAKAAFAVWPGGLVRYTWVPRERNKDADRLANEALDAAARGLPWTPGVGRLTRSGREVATDSEPVAGSRLIGWGHDLGEPTTLRLLRHGETVHTRQKRFSGAGGDDPGLSERGVAQATAAAAMLAARGGLDVVVTSPLARTRQTAAVVAQALGLQVEVEVDDDVAECAFGDWEGLTFTEVEQAWPDALAAWLGSTAVAPPGGESFDQVERRVRRSRDRIVDVHRGRGVLVVSHVTPIKTFVRLALGAPPSALYRMELSPASLTTVAWYVDGNASLRTFNDIAHLDGLLDSVHL
jgi:ribonuclease H / adenosylcobalamin/alpha-ribazole phosphatase